MFETLDLKDNLIYILTKKQQITRFCVDFFPKISTKKPILLYSQLKVSKIFTKKPIVT